MYWPAQGEGPTIDRPMTTTQKIIIKKIIIKKKRRRRSEIISTIVCLVGLGCFTIQKDRVWRRWFGAGVVWSPCRSRSTRRRSGRRRRVLPPWSTGCCTGRWSWLCVSTSRRTKSRTTATLVAVIWSAPAQSKIAISFFIF